MSYPNWSITDTSLRQHHHSWIQTPNLEDWLNLWAEKLTLVPVLWAISWVIIRITSLIIVRWSFTVFEFAIVEAKASQLKQNTPICLILYGIEPVEQLLQDLVSVDWKYVFIGWFFPYRAPGRLGLSVFYVKIRDCEFMSKVYGPALTLQEPSFVDQLGYAVHRYNLLYVMLMHKAFLNKLKLLVVVDPPLAPIWSFQTRAEPAKKRQYHRLECIGEVISTEVSLTAHLLSDSFFSLLVCDHCGADKTCPISKITISLRV